MSGSDPQDRAVLLLQRTRELMLKCRVVAEQLAAATENAPTAESGERIAYGVLVAALEEGLVNALRYAVIVLRNFKTPAGVLGGSVSASCWHVAAARMGEGAGRPGPTPSPPGTGYPTLLVVVLETARTDAVVIATTTITRRRVVRDRAVRLAGREAGTVDLDPRIAVVVGEVAGD